MGKVPRPLATHSPPASPGQFAYVAGAINLITVNEAEEVDEEKMRESEREIERERSGGCTSIRLFATPHALRIEWARARECNALSTKMES